MHVTWKATDPNDPASASTIASVESDLGLQLPEQYIAFLMTTNGGEGPLGNSGYLQLWPVEDLKGLNDTYEVVDSAPGLLLFGSDGGNVGYAFDKYRGMEIVSVPLVGMCRDDVQQMAVGFFDFMDTLDPVTSPSEE